MAIITHAHTPLNPLASNLWDVSAQTSQGIDRRMTVARGDDGSLFLHDTLRLNDATFAQLDALGPVNTIFVSSFLHDFDGNFFADLYPRAHFCAMPTTVKRLGWPKLKELVPSMLPPGVTLTAIPGLRFDEVVCEVRHPEGGVSLIFTDAMFNQPHRDGMRGWMYRLMGSSGPLHMTPLGRMMLLADKQAFRSWLMQQAARADVKNLLVAHGEPVCLNAPARLAEVAARL